ncbi:MAG: DUF1146 domain-containing protein [Bacilli bacterium]|nr:DUF1146 domain-containing protein [Bacilli bacterium]
MNYKLYVYVICILLSIFALTGVNFEKITRKNKTTEIRILILLLGFIIGYLISNFIFDFIECTKII